jgi:hypothetical protein
LSHFGEAAYRRLTANKGRNTKQKPTLIPDRIIPCFHRNSIAGKEVIQFTHDGVGLS